MPGFDTTSVAADVGQNQQNPIQLIEGLAFTRNAMNQNRMFQAQAQAGQYLTQSIDPATGQVDPAKLNQFFQQNPAAAMAAPEALRNAFGLQGQGIQNTQNQTNLSQSYMDHLWANLASVPRDPDETTYKRNLVDAATEGALAGQYTPQWLSNVYGGQTPDGTDFGSLLEGVAKQGAISGAAGTGGFQAQFGDNATIGTGGGTQAININPVTHVETNLGGPSGGFIPKTLGPTDLASKVTTVDQDGAQKMGVLGDYVNPNGSWKDGVPHPMTALGPLSANTQASLGAAYGPQIASFEQNAAQAPQTRNLIENMRQEADQFDAGPQSDAYKKWGELLSEYHIPAPNFASMDQTGAREAFAKTAVMALGNQQQLLHMDQTDAARQTAAASVPGSMTSPGGRQQVLGILEGNADMIDAAGKAWQAQKTKGGPATWGQFQMEFPNKVPPSIFQAQYMTPAQIADLQKGWSPSKVADWQRRFDKAKDLGWLPNAQ